MGLPSSPSLDMFDLWTRSSASSDPPYSQHIESRHKQDLQALSVRFRMVRFEMHYEFFIFFIDQIPLHSPVVRELLISYAVRMQFWSSALRTTM